eukprot:4766182-Prymnesium_polylepis.1
MPCGRIMISARAHDMPTRAHNMGAHMTSAHANFLCAQFERGSRHGRASESLFMDDTTAVETFRKVADDIKKVLPSESAKRPESPGAVAGAQIAHLM